MKGGVGGESEGGRGGGEEGGLRGDEGKRRGEGRGYCTRGCEQQ